MRNIIKQAAPEAVEKQNYKVPTFTLVPDGKRDQQIMMVAYAKFVSFYPFPATVAHFADQLTDYKLVKGAIQFPFDTKLPEELIIKMIKHRKEEIMKNWES